MTPEAFRNADKFIVDEWFRDHEAHYTYWPLQDMEKVIWKKPGTSSYLMNYILAGSYLHVSGDVGDAIYCSGMGSLERWAFCDFSYFSGKCVASEEGRQYLEWDGDFLLRNIKETLKNYSNKSWKDFEKANGLSFISFEQEWYSWLNKHADEFFGSDPTCWPINGKRVAVRCVGHLIGLQMIVKQLKEKGVLK